MSKKASYDSEKKINETRDSLNRILNPWGNEVYVFDFGHYYNDETINDDTNNYFFKTVIKGSKQYIETLFPKGKDDSTKYKHFKSSIKEVCNISSKMNIDDDFSSFDLPIKKIVAENEFRTLDWVNDLKEKKIGGCLLVSSIVAGNHQSAVWVVLKKPIKGLINGMTYCFMPCEVCSEKRKGLNCSKGLVSLRDDKINTIFRIIDDLLINEIYNYLPDFFLEIARKYFDVEKNITIEKGVSGIDAILSEIRELVNNSNTKELAKS